MRKSSLQKILQTWWMLSISAMGTARTHKAKKEPQWFFFVRYNAIVSTRVCLVCWQLHIYSIMYIDKIMINHVFGYYNMILFFILALYVMHDIFTI